MKLSEIEAKFGIRLPLRHRQAIEQLDDPIHEAVDFLLPTSEYELLRLEDMNDWLRACEYNPWPPFLFAFASNGCGDYFAYDSRPGKPAIIYIDPDHTIEENLIAEDQLSYGSFEEWYEDNLRVDDEGD